MTSEAVSVVPFTITPSRPAPLIVNFATCEASVSSRGTSLPEPSITFLSSFTAVISSVATILSPSAEASILELPSVTVELDLITPFSISKPKVVVTLLNPSGAVVSVSS